MHFPEDAGPTQAGRKSNERVAVEVDVFCAQAEKSSSSPGVSTWFTVVLVPRSIVRRRWPSKFPTGTVHRTGTVEVPTSRTGLAAEAAAGTQDRGVWADAELRVTGGRRVDADLDAPRGQRRRLDADPVEQPA
jgi:hypothetical protein